MCTYLGCLNHAIISLACIRLLTIIFMFKNGVLDKKVDGTHGYNGVPTITPLPSDAIVGKTQNVDGLHMLTFVRTILAYEATVDSSVRMVTTASG